MIRRTIYAFVVRIGCKTLIYSNHVTILICLCILVDDIWNQRWLNCCSPEPPELRCIPPPYNPSVRRLRRVTRKYEAARRNGHYSISPAVIDDGTTIKLPGKLHGRIQRGWGDRGSGTPSNFQGMGLLNPGLKLDPPWSEAGSAHELHKLLLWNKIKSNHFEELIRNVL